MDKESAEYFMKNMTQEEFDAMIEINEIKPYKFNGLRTIPSNTQDMKDLGHEFVTVGCTDHRYCVKCGEEDHVVKSNGRRCN
jgi:hypothetical protein